MKIDKFTEIMQNGNSKRHSSSYGRKGESPSGGFVRPDASHFKSSPKINKIVLENSFPLNPQKQVND